ncbi:MAG: tRNA-uridine aminocarboxypropyltransferase [Ghiorsea sp.]|nr:tRNA-uridine aminocarboxypropyltransferase [Ghiorsea sp.]
MKALCTLHIYLLTHSRELERPTNTGVLVKQVLGQQCTVLEWQRKLPNPDLLLHIQHKAIALVYPHSTSHELQKQSKHFDSFILLDATWQEAQKMYNHSPYLHDLPKFSLKLDAPSIYTLRRNQKETGLCTAECAIKLLKLHQQTKQADMIHNHLRSFIQQNLH